jgi:hypothetical protein
MHGGRVADGFARTAASLFAAIVVVAVSVAGCGSTGSHKSKTARTVALAPAEAVAPLAGASGGASLAPGHATSGQEAPAHAAAVTSHHKTPSSTTTTTIAAQTTTTATTTRSNGLVPTRRVRKKAPPRHPSTPPATPGQSGHVVTCLNRAGLAHVSADRRILWTGWNSQTGTFVYVEAYPTVPAAAFAANQLAPEEAAVAGRYVVHQPIARYAGSPVPVVAGCLTGHPVHRGKPSQKPGSFTF